MLHFRSVKAIRTKWMWPEEIYLGDVRVRNLKVHTVISTVFSCTNVSSLPEMLRLTTQGFTDIDLALVVHSTKLKLNLTIMYYLLPWLSTRHCIRNETGMPTWEKHRPRWQKSNDLICGVGQEWSNGDERNK